MVQAKLISIGAYIEDDENPPVGDSGIAEYDEKDRKDYDEGKTSYVNLLLKIIYGVPRGGESLHLHTTYETLGGVGIGTSNSKEIAEGNKYMREEFENLLSEAKAELKEFGIPAEDVEKKGHEAIERAFTSSAPSRNVYPRNAEIYNMIDLRRE
jgi:hypothetical protein